MFGEVCLLPLYCCNQSLKCLKFVVYVAKSGAHSSERKHLVEWGRSILCRVGHIIVKESILSSERKHLVEWGRSILSIVKESILYKQSGAHSSEKKH